MTDTAPVPQRAGGYARRSFERRCQDCDRIFLGSERAIRCPACARLPLGSGHVIDPPAKGPRA